MRAAVEVGQELLATAEQDRHDRQLHLVAQARAEVALDGVTAWMYDQHDAPGAVQPDQDEDVGSPREVPGGRTWPGDRT